MELQDASAIVTGGNSGIGAAIAAALAQAGARTVIAARRADRNAQVARELREQHGRDTLAVTTDVSREADCERLIHTTLDRFGRLDVLVNNAGIGSHGTIAQTSSAEFARVLQTNLAGTFWCARAAFRAMKERGGAIINISSLAGVDAWAGTGTYSASKYGVMGLTRALADEGREFGIRCTAICPALVATPLSGVTGADYLQPADIAATVLWLLRLSPAAWPTEIVLPRRGAD